MGKRMNGLVLLVGVCFLNDLGASGFLRSWAGIFWKGSIWLARLRGGSAAGPLHWYSGRHTCLSVVPKTSSKEESCKLEISGLGNVVKARPLIATQASVHEHKANQLSPVHN